MGFLNNSLRALIPERKVAVGATIATWDNGREQSPPVGSDYEHNAREGYMVADLVYACIEERCTSAGEPPMCAYQLSSNGEEKIEGDDHPALALLKRPNPFMGHSRFWSTVVMHLDIGGNAYIEKVRSGAGKVVELWLLRPDRVKVVPDAQTFVRAYTYTIGDKTDVLPAEDVIHFRTRHPLDDYYGLPPLAAAAGRVDLDIWARKFSSSFFRNAGVPAGLLNVKRSMSAQEKADARRNFRELYNGPEGWGNLLLIDAEQATYTPMGLPLGGAGAAMPELNQINESRILAAFGVEASMLPTILGANSSSYANRLSDRALFWESTMVPLFRDLDSMLTLGLQPEYPDLERLSHDLDKVKALQEDEDKRHERIREDYKAGVITWKEARAKLGEPEEPDEAGIVLVPSSMVPTWSDEMLVEPAPMEPPQAPAALPAPANGRANGAARY